MLLWEIMFCDKSETMNTSRLALIVLATGLLCVGTAGCKDDNKNKFDASVLFVASILRILRVCCSFSTYFTIIYNTFF